MPVHPLVRLMVGMPFMPVRDLHSKVRFACGSQHRCCGDDEDDDELSVRVRTLRGRQLGEFEEIVEKCDGC